MICSLTNSARCNKNSLFGVDLLNMADFITNIITLFQIDKCADNFDSNYKKRNSHYIYLIKKDRYDYWNLLALKNVIFSSQVKTEDIAKIERQCKEYTKVNFK